MKWRPHRPKPLALTWRRKAGGARTRGHVASSRAPATLVSQSEPRTPPPSLAEAGRDHPKCTTDSSPLPREVSLNFFQRKRVCCVSWASVRPWTESWRLSLPAACRPLGPHGSASSLTVLTVRGLAGPPRKPQKIPEHVRWKELTFQKEKVERTNPFSTQTCSGRFDPAEGHSQSR